MRRTRQTCSTILHLLYLSEHVLQIDHALFLYTYIYIYIYVCVCVCACIHSVFCLTTSPKPPPKRFLHIVRSRASSFKREYPLLSLRSSSSFLGLLPRLLVTSISPFIFPSITCFRGQFLRKMWPIQLAFRFLISCSLTLICMYVCMYVCMCVYLYIYIYILDDDDDNYEMCVEMRIMICYSI